MSRTTVVMAATLLTLLAGGRPARGEEPEIDGVRYLPASECAKCHEDQQQEWAVSAHAASGVQCFECHGVIHSGSLNGCKRCHRATHKRRFANWPAVQRFDNDDGVDFMCMVCHYAHSTRMQAHLQAGCARCHADPEHTALADLLHREFAAARSPIEMDVYARERATGEAWRAELPAAVVRLYSVLQDLGTFGLLFLLALPFALVLTTGWRLIAGVGSRHRSDRAGHTTDFRPGSSTRSAPDSSSTETSDSSP